LDLWLAPRGVRLSGMATRDKIKRKLAADLRAGNVSSEKGLLRRMRRKLDDESIDQADVRRALRALEGEGVARQSLGHWRSA